MAERIYYDRDVDIVYIKLYDDPVAPIRAEEHDWGLLESDATRALVGIEIWNVSKLAAPDAVDQRKEER